MRRFAFPALALFATVLTLPLLSLVPVSPMSATRDQPGCRIAPLSAARLAAVAGGLTPAAIAPTVNPRPNPYPKDELPFADDHTIAAIWAVVREAAACLEAGDAPRLYALYSDDFLRRTIGGTEGSGDGSGLPAVPVWRGSWVLEDGRIGAVFSGPRLAKTSEEPPVYFMFAKVGHHWLIDDVIPFARAMTAGIQPFV